METLTPEEEQKVAQLVKTATNAQYQLDNALAQRFLLARKGNADDAFRLFKEYVNRFGEYNLLQLTPNELAVKTQLNLGKYCIPGIRATDGSSVVVFVAKHHRKCTTEQELHANLQACFFCLTYVLSSVLAQRCGVTFIFDMQSARYRNIDTALMKTMLTLVKNAFPGRLSQAFIYKAPKWFKALVTLVRPFIKAKMKERIKFVSTLKAHADLASLPTSLGGKADYDHERIMGHILGNSSFLKGQTALSLRREHRHFSNAPARTQSASNNKPQLAEHPEQRRHHTVNVSAAEQPRATVEGKGSLRRRRLEEQAIIRTGAPQSTGKSDAVGDAESRSSSVTATALPQKKQRKKTPYSKYDVDKANFGREARSLFASGDVLGQYSLLQLESYPSDHFAAMDRANQGKNRYRNILPFDSTRVKLQDVPKGSTDYINASYVNGYSREREYIASQGPVEKTVDDFWQMVWENDSPVIVMMAQVIEEGRPKCHPYWTKQNCRSLFVEIEQEEKVDHIVHRKIKLIHGPSKETRVVHQFQFVSWPDHGIPRDAHDFLTLRSLVHRHTAESSLSGPIVVHCSAGVGRTGTYITIDITLNQIQVESTGNIFDTIRRLRLQRPSMVQTPMQYLFCYHVVAAAEGDPVDFADEEDDE